MQFAIYTPGDCLLRLRELSDANRQLPVLVLQRPHTAEETYLIEQLAYDGHPLVGLETICPPEVLSGLLDQPAHLTQKVCEHLDRESAWFRAVGLQFLTLDFRLGERIQPISTHEINQLILFFNLAGQSDELKALELPVKVALPNIPGGQSLQVLQNLTVQIPQLKWAIDLHFAEMSEETSTLTWCCEQAKSLTAIKLIFSQNEGLPATAERFQTWQTALATAGFTGWFIVAFQSAEDLQQHLCTFNEWFELALPLNRSNTMSLNVLPLEAKHVELGAKMVPFGGWNMPVQYTEGILKEHEHTRTETGLFDISHMGEFRVKGAGAIEAIDQLLGRDLVGQKVGIARYNFLMNENGGVEDDLIIYKISDEELFIVVNAAMAPTDAALIQAALPADCTFEDISARTGKLDLQGPKAFEVLEAIGIKTEDLPGYFKFIQTEVQGIPCILSRTGYTGERGVEFYVDVQYIEQLWDLLIAQDTVKPIGLGARDTLRLEVGYALYGHELNPETTPIDLGYGGMIKLDRQFTGVEALRNNPRQKFLTAITLEGRRAAREGTAIFAADETPIGTVTSGSYGPSVGAAIALAFIDRELAPGTELLLGKAPKYLKGQVATLPFYTEGTVRS